MSDLILQSDSFADGDYLADTHILSEAYGFGCAGGNQSPHFAWSGAPAGTESFALTCFDPDAPTGSGFWHWVVVNIPADVRSLPLGAGKADGSLLPSGAIQVRNDYGTQGFGGAAPPRGDKPHRYIFRLHALKVDRLPITPETTNAVARFMTHLNELDSTTYTGLYELK